MIILYITVILGTSLPSGLTAGIYTIIAPQVLRPNSDYRVSVSVMNTTIPVDVTVEVSQMIRTRANAISTKRTTVESDSSKIIKFQFGELQPGRYQLLIKGNGGLSFQNRTDIQYEHKSYSVFIQTDRAVYRSGNDVNFRVILVTPQLKPGVTGAIDVNVTDSKGHLIRKWNRVFTANGVFAGSFKLADELQYGDWNITVSFLGQLFKKTFVVGRFLFPKFEIKVDVPGFVTFDDSSMVANIQARYLHGKPVRGEAILEVTALYKSGRLQPIFTEPLRRVVPIDGRVTVPFNLAPELGIVDDNEREIRFDVRVEEPMTGRRSNVTAYMKMVKYRYQLELIKSSSTFKPGLKYTAFIRVTHPDGTPVQDGEKQLTIRHGFSNVTETYDTTKHWILEDGTAEVDFYPPPFENVTILGIEAAYRDANESLGYILRSYSENPVYIQTELKTKDPTINQQIIIAVNSTQALRSFVYEIMGRGDIVFAQTIQALGRKTREFKFLCTPSMAPKARIIVHYLTDAGEIIADALDFRVKGSIQNEVQVQVNRPVAAPGDSLEITVLTKPNSFVGIMGIDSSVNKLKQGGDLTRGTILKELETYDSTLVYAEHPSKLHWLGSGTTADVFEESGVVIFTNGYLYNDPNSSQDTIRFKPTRPPLAGPYAFSRIPRPIDDIPLYNVVRDFYDTLIFDNSTSDGSGKATFTVTVPKNTTSWTISAFSANSIYGLGVNENAVEVEVTQPLTVDMNVPVDIYLGEVVALEVVVSNGLGREMIADVSFLVDKNVKVIETSNDLKDEQETSTPITKSVTVGPLDVTVIPYIVKPVSAGEVKIEVDVSGSGKTVKMIKYMKVKYQGDRHYYNKATLLDLRESSNFEKNITIDLPVNIVNNSYVIEVSAVADLLTPSIANVEKLLRLPLGSCEPNLNHFIPNAVLIDYLKKTKRLKADIYGKAVGSIQDAYQKQLTFRHLDGSFSAFGKRDEVGSIWLTSLVIRSFIRVQPYIDIDPMVIDTALDWLLSKQESDGGFKETGPIIHTHIQGEGSSSVALTAFVLLAILEAQGEKGANKQISKAVNFLSVSVSSLEDPYSLAVATYALLTVDHPYGDIALGQLEQKAKTMDDMTFWMMDREEIPEDAPWRNQPNSLDVETTAYALLSYAQKGVQSQAFGVAKWLVTQRSDHGGFSSTTDTMAAIEALAAVYDTFQVPTNIEVTFMFDNIRKKTMFVNDENSIILQRFELPPGPREVVVKAEGSGIAVINVAYSYTLKVTGAYPSFSLDPQVDKNADQNYLQMSICTGYTGSGRTNMAVIDVDLPSGFTADKDVLPSIRKYNDDVKLVETRDDGRGFIIYLEKLDNKETCPTVSAYRSQMVASQKPVAVKVYDYYDNTKQSRVFYQQLTSTICDICVDTSCPNLNCNEIKEGATATAQEGELGSSPADKPMPVVFVIFIINIIIQCAFKYIYV